MGGQAVENQQSDKPRGQSILLQSKQVRSLCISCSESFLSIILAMSTTEEAAGSACPTVALELVETIRAVVGELLDQRRTTDRGGVPPDAAGSSGAGPSRAAIEGG